MVEIAARLRFLGLAEARMSISKPDFYSGNLSAFDIAAKVRRRTATTEADYLANTTMFARGWTPDEIDYLTHVAVATERRMTDLRIEPVLPDQLLLVKTTGWEEGGANGYTRSNMMVLNHRSMAADLFHHELFHVISRHNEAMRDAAYATLGFMRRAVFDFSDPLRISNPDAPSSEHSIYVDYRGNMVEAAIVLRASRPYVDGGFFSYVTKRLLVIATGDLLRFEDVRGLYRQIGRNTGYTLHQEEICADHFSMLLAGDQWRVMPNPELVAHLHGALTA